MTCWCWCCSTYGEWENDFWLSNIANPQLRCFRRVFAMYHRNSPFSLQDAATAAVRSPIHRILWLGMWEIFVTSHVVFARATLMVAWRRLLLWWVSATAEPVELEMNEMKKKWKLREQEFPFCARRRRRRSPIWNLTINLVCFVCFLRFGAWMLCNDGALKV